jgi:hypothetical protein
MSDAATAGREPWPDLDRQREGVLVLVGIWLFMVSEVWFSGADRDPAAALRRAWSVP